jgi:hypothetical protein
MPSTNIPRPTSLAVALLGVLLGASIALAAADYADYEDEGAYGYFRTVDGSAVVRGLDETYDAEVNRPLLTGDVIQTRFGSRLEAILPDGTRLRIGSDAEIQLDQLAYSGDQQSDTTLLLLQHGEIVVTVPGDRPVDSPLRVDTPNTTVYLDDVGTYWLSSRGYVTQIVVREGRAEALTSQGEHRLRAGDHAWVEGTEWPQVEIGRAGTRSELERWAYDLDLEAEREAARAGTYVDGSLGYSTSRLARYGSWHAYDDGHYWRPTRVSAGWRPYDDGYWTHTPSGLTWVSYEPWGWATYHYGTWDYHPAHGWVWYPGHRYAPAWVYWYWGPRYVGWCPVGYYTSYYGYGSHWYGGWRTGIYGWGGGSTRHWERWNFVDHDRFGDRRLARHTRPGAHLQAIQDHLDRGIITSDTSVLGRDALEKPRTAVRVLEDAKRTRSGGELPDLTDFVARKNDIPADLKRLAMPVQGGRPDGTPARTIGVTPRRPDDARIGRDDRGVRSRVPTGVRPAPGATPTAPPKRTDSGGAPAVRPRATPPDRPDATSTPRVIRPRPDAPDRGTAPRGYSETVNDWRRREAAPRARDERPQEVRSLSPARRVLEGVRSARPSTPPPAARGAGATPVRPRSVTPPPPRTTSERPDRPTSRPSVSPRSVSSRPSRSSSSVRSTSRPDRSSGSSSVRQRSSSTSSRSSATSRRDSGTSSRSSSRSSASRSRRSSDPDR